MIDTIYIVAALGAVVGSLVTIAWKAVFTKPAETQIKASFKVIDRDARSSEKTMQLLHMLRDRTDWDYDTRVIDQYVDVVDVGTSYEAIVKMQDLMHSIVNSTFVDMAGADKTVKNIFVVHFLNQYLEQFNLAIMVPQLTQEQFSTYKDLLRKNEICMDVTEPSGNNIQVRNRASHVTKLTNATGSKGVFAEVRLDKDDDDVMETVSEIVDTVDSLLESGDKPASEEMNSRFADDEEGHRRRRLEARSADDNLVNTAALTAVAVASMASDDIPRQQESAPVETSSPDTSSTSDTGGDY